MQEAKKEEVLEEVLEDLEKESQADQTEDSVKEAETTEDTASETEEKDTEETAEETEESSKEDSDDNKKGFFKKKVCLAVLPALTIVLELLPLGAVCIFATSPTERVKETFSYFSLTPFGYANFAPLITATLTVAIFLLSLFSLKKKCVLKALFVLSIITVVISLLPLMYGLNYYTLVGAFITVTLVIESILAKIQQK